ncbi:MAG: hypothetical protein ABJM06_12465 [Gilvibacter sp.]
MITFLNKQKLRFYAFAAMAFIFLGVSLQSCNKDDGPLNNNPNLANIGVNLTLDLNLPQYNPLNFPGNSFVTGLQGIKGIVIYNIDNSQYTAHEITDPNHPPNDCSASQIDGLTATCSCGDGNEYNIVTGQQTAGEGQYPLRAYQIVREGDVLRITN